ncbi:hypothetical protein KR51_00003950 [Rubidibacter lacunae KORDI 51-2]|uniref:Uncharacterized protein n=2 Tax=Rubidibacter TaxID=582491 RepID=U5DEC8_9CHRO|nr:hypothetical protein KR51_00003950 [Rubidibacter lacunae KORDI 51-2]
MRGSSYKWRPRADVTRHSGSTIQLNMDFFESPPTSIGTVLTAESNLKTNQNGFPKEHRIGIVGVIVLACILLLQALAVPTAVAIFVGLGGGAIAFFATRFSHRCSYVGEKGIVEYSLVGSRTHRPKIVRELRFADARNLFTTVTHTHYNFIYIGTSYSYRWTRPDGKNLLVISGGHMRRHAKPKDENLWHFLNSAENSWSNYCLQQINEQLDRQGYVEFTIPSGNPRFVRVGPGFMEFVMRKGDPHRIAVTDMKNITLHSGYFRFSHRDAGWWGKGNFSFTYSGISNAKLFLLCLDQLAGISWS